MEPSSPDNFMAPSSPYKFMEPSSPDNFMGPSSPDNFMRSSSPYNFMGPSSPNNFMRPSSPDNFMGCLVGPRALLDSVIPIFNRCSAPTMRNRIYCRCKILEAGPKGKNTCITSNFRHETGVVCNPYCKRKINFRYRK